MFLQMTHRLVATSVQRGQSSGSFFPFCVDAMMAELVVADARVLVDSSVVMGWILGDDKVRLL